VHKQKKTGKVREECMVTNVCVTGYRPGVLVQMIRLTTHLLIVARLADPPLPGPKTFSPKFDLPILRCYRGRAPEKYWEKFPSKPLGKREIDDHCSEGWQQWWAVGIRRDWTWCAGT
jgi:hypothetical protein